MIKLTGLGRVDVVRVKDSQKGRSKGKREKKGGKTEKPRSQTDAIERPKWGRRGRQVKGGKRNKGCANGEGQRIRSSKASTGKGCREKEKKMQNKEARNLGRRERVSSF